MGKIFEALQKAKKTEAKHDQSPGSKVKGKGARDSLRVITSAGNLSTTGELEYKKPGFSTPPTDNPYLLLNAQDKPEVLEQYRLLRSSIFSLQQEGLKPKCIMVTSPVAREGKSTIACNLAISVALGVHERVILIDADMRRPSLHKMLGVTYKFGLADYLLRDDIDVQDIIYPTVVEKLFFIPSGSSEAKMSTELLASNKMRALIIETKSKYREQYVVLDTPPCSLTSDPGVLAETADTVLLVVGNGRSTKEQISDAIKSLGKDKICGIVFNCADYHLGLKKYYYQYSQYYGSG